jgi:hypothetical protein
MPVYDTNGVTSPAQEEFRRDLQAVLNKHSRENGSNTPDYVLADYLIECLRALDKAILVRGEWHGERTQYTVAPIDVDALLDNGVSAQIKAVRNPFPAAGAISQGVAKIPDKQ